MGYPYQYAETWILNHQHFPVMGNIIEVHILYLTISERQLKKNACINGYKHRIATLFQSQEVRRSWDSIVHTGLSYRLDGLRFKSLYIRRFLSSTKCQRLTLWPNQPPIQRVPGVLSQGSGGHGRMLNTHIHLPLRLRMSTGIPLNSLQVFIAWTWTTLPFCSITASGYSSNFWFPALTICTSQSSHSKIKKTSEYRDPGPQVLNSTKLWSLALFALSHCLEVRRVFEGTHLCQPKYQMVLLSAVLNFVVSSLSFYVKTVSV